MSKRKVKGDSSGEQAELPWGQQEQRTEFAVCWEKQGNGWQDRECLRLEGQRVLPMQSVLLKVLVVIPRVVESL